MMSLRIRSLFSTVLFSVAAVAAVIALLSGVLSPADGADDVSRFGRSLSSRLSFLESCVDKTGGELPRDMVVYTYCDDSLICWRGQFPISDDNISRRVPSVPGGGSPLVSPLLAIGPEYGYIRLGDTKYLARRIDKGRITHIVGLEIVSPGAGFTVHSPDFPSGIPVYFEDALVLKIVRDSRSGSHPSGVGLFWISYFLFCIALSLFLSSKPDVRRFCVCVASLLLLTALMYVYVNTLPGGAGMLPHNFSPGVVLPVNSFILFSTVFLSVAREGVRRVVSRVGRGLFRVLCALILTCILLYTHFSLVDIVRNAGVPLELYEPVLLSPLSFVIIVSYLSMLLSVGVLLQLMVRGIGVWGKALISLSVALYLVSVTTVYSLEKEKTRMDTVSDRLVMDRDINLEMLLLRDEEAIAGEIGSLAEKMPGNLLEDRIKDDFFSGLQGGYSVSLYKGSNLKDGSDMPFDSFPGAVSRLSPSSRFVYFEDGSVSQYVAFFDNEYDSGSVRVALSVEPRFGSLPSGRTGLSPKYSYALYKNGKLKSFRGPYAYPTVENLDFAGNKSDANIHFVKIFDDGSAVVISRPRVSFFSYVVAVVFLGLVLFILLLAVSVPSRRKPDVRRGYFKREMSLVTMTSLVLAMGIIITASVSFILSGGKSTMASIMSERIGNIQAAVQTSLAEVCSADDLYSPGIRRKLEDICRYTGCSISLYSLQGSLIRQCGGNQGHQGTFRISADALSRISADKARYYVERVSRGVGYQYNMYAPLFGQDGNMVAVMRTPYNGIETFRLERDGVAYAIVILSFFVILLFVVKFATDRIFAGLLNPLRDMSEKMNSAGLDSLEHIEYGRADEVSSIVEAYNRMVDKLRENSGQLAQAERDKAWTGMARQVAHEIKNPLTPMKLQIQRLIRLKQKGGSEWMEKFDEVSKVLLDHISILTETADEFSSFARLYTEEPTEIDLDAVLQEELAMFSGREDIEFEYFGMSGVVVKGPRPQLTRVFVNLINNAVQALDGDMQPESGRKCVRVALRRSSRDGFYDIAVEDSGSGVPEENVVKLFTPNFTTKNGGSGLGLAISKSVLDSCGATIRYEKSFSLGGAAFIVSYPAGPGGVQSSSSS